MYVLLPRWVLLAVATARRITWRCASQLCKAAADGNLENVAKHIAEDGVDVNARHPMVRWVVEAIPAVICRDLDRGVVGVVTWDARRKRNTHIIRAAGRPSCLH